MYALGGNSSFNVSAVAGVKLYMYYAKARRQGPPQRLVDAKSLNTIEGYRRFAVIRNPFDRFVSAYNHVILTLKNHPARRQLDKWSQQRHAISTLHSLCNIFRCASTSSMQQHVFEELQTVLAFFSHTASKNVYMHVIAGWSVNGFVLCVLRSA